MAAHVIALANLKGGCGKTTLSINLASGLARRAEVGLIDADPQGALRHWAGAKPSRACHVCSTNTTMPMPTSRRQGRPATT